MKASLIGTIVTLAASLALVGCDGGGGTSDCTPTNGGIEACGDMIDNDCDGQADEGCTTGGCTTGETRGCGGSPTANVCVETCNNGLWGTCQVAMGTGQEVCGDGIDNNCNGQIDESTACQCNPGEERGCGGSPAANVCVETCNAGRWSTCAPKPPNTATENCDGQDDDCDGTIDEDCDCTDGETQWCGGSPGAHTCQQTCGASGWSACEPTSGREEDEVCDGDDNDCDGQVDEPIACTNSCGRGEQVCAGDEYTSCQVEGAECAPDDTRTRDCTGSAANECGTGIETSTCNDSCRWGDYGSCEGLTTPSTYGDVSSCINAYNLGEDPDAVFPVYMDAAQWESQWFVLTAVDNFTIFGSEDIIVETRDVPTDLDIYLYQYSCSAEIGFSDNFGRGNDRVEWSEETCDGCDDDGAYYIEIINAGGGTGCYNLYVNGLN